MHDESKGDWRGRHTGSGCPFAVEAAEDAEEHADDRTAAQGPGRHVRGHERLSAEGMTNSRAPMIPRSNPTAAPRKVVSMLSTRTRPAICGPLKPTAESRANSVRRSTRAVSIVFATPMPPMTSASTAITSPNWARLRSAPDRSWTKAYPFGPSDPRYGYLTRTYD
jgi:hypothetical protein